MGRHADGDVCNQLKTRSLKQQLRMAKSSFHSFQGLSGFAVRVVPIRKVSDAKMQVPVRNGYL